jgi:hypothetical protein
MTFLISKAIEPMIHNPTSVHDLVCKFQNLFYQQTPDQLTHQVFNERRLLDRQTIIAYTSAYEQNQLDFARSQNLPEEDIKQIMFPLLETLAWWIAFTSSQQCCHGMRSFVTPSSTFIEGERLGVAFLVNECLRVSYTFVKRETVHPNSKIWPAIKS